MILKRGVVNVTNLPWAGLDPLLAEVSVGLGPVVTWGTNVPCEVVYDTGFPLDGLPVWIGFFSRGRFMM